MKQAIGTLTLLLMTASAWAQNPATTLKSTQANVQSVQQQKQASLNQASGTSAKTPAAKPVAHSAAVKTQSAKPNAVAVKSSVSTVKVNPKASATAHSTAPATQNAKPATVAVKAPATAPKAVVKPSAQVATNHTAPAASQSAKNISAKPAQAVVKTVSAKPAQIAIKTGTTPAVKSVAAKAAPVAKLKTSAPAKEVVAAKVDVKDTSKPEGSPKAEAEKADNSEKKETSKYINVAGRHDPFVSPVVAESEGGSGCSVGKKCLAIDQISVRGVVKADSGMIAVVVNALDKAYFLRENDPVFNGYVEKITEDSIIFKETYQDKLGKPLTRDITKRIQAPAV
jgi:Tfp pilus assembly protein PilP